MNQDINPTPTNGELNTTKFSGQKNVEKLIQTFKNIDLKLEKIIPNSILRKTLYITISVFVTVFLLLILVAMSMGGRQTQNTGFVLNQPKIVGQATNKPVEMSENNKLINDLNSKIINLKLPPPELNEPSVLFEIKI